MMMVRMRGGCSSVVEPPPPNQKVPGSSPGPGIVQVGYGCTTHVVVPRRSDGTLNRGLVCVAHQTWTIKIPTSLRKRICDCRLIQNCKQKKRKKKKKYVLSESSEC